MTIAPAGNHHLHSTSIITRERVRYCNAYLHYKKNAAYLHPANARVRWIFNVTRPSTYYADFAMHKYTPYTCIVTIAPAGDAACSVGRKIRKFRSPGGRRHAEGLLRVHEEKEKSNRTHYHVPRTAIEGVGSRNLCCVSLRAGFLRLSSLFFTHGCNRIECDTSACKCVRRRLLIAARSVPHCFPSNLQPVVSVEVTYPNGFRVSTGCGWGSLHVEGRGRTGSTTDGLRVREPRDDGWCERVRRGRPPVRPNGAALERNSLSIR